MSEQKQSCYQIEMSFSESPVVQTMVRTARWRYPAYDRWFTFSASQLRTLGENIKNSEAYVQYKEESSLQPIDIIDEDNVLCEGPSFGFFDTQGQDSTSSFKNNPLPAVS
jgi:hypothetical protein